MCSWAAGQVKESARLRSARAQRAAALNRPPPCACDAFILDSQPLTWLPRVAGSFTIPLTGEVLEMRSTAHSIKQFPLVAFKVKSDLLQYIPFLASLNICRLPPLSMIIAPFCGRLPLKSSPNICKYILAL